MNRRMLSNRSARSHGGHSWRTTMYLNMLLMYMYVIIQKPTILLEHLHHHLIPRHVHVAESIFSFYRNIPTAPNYTSWNIPIDYLLQSGATALIRASQNGHKETAALLLEHSANVDTQDEVIVVKLDLPLLAHLYIMDCILYILCTSVIVPFNSV